MSSELKERMEKSGAVINNISKNLSNGSRKFTDSKGEDSDNAEKSDFNQVKYDGMYF